MALRAGDGPFASCAGRLASCTGRASSLGAAGPPPAPAIILIVSPDGWASPHAAVEALAGRGFRVVISAQFSDLYLYNLIKGGILPVGLAHGAVARLQAVVENDPGILLTVDFDRQEVRTRGDLSAPFEIADGVESMSRRLLMARRLLDAADLVGDSRVRMQRRLAVICDALKAPGADLARSAARLNRLLGDLALVGHAGQAPERPDGTA
jgi:hypothetical protein